MRQKPRLDDGKQRRLWIIIGVTAMVAVSWGFFQFRATSSLNAQQRHVRVLTANHPVDMRLRFLPTSGPSLADEIGFHADGETISQRLPRSCVERDLTYAGAHRHIAYILDGPVGVLQETKQCGSA